MDREWLLLGPDIISWIHGLVPSDFPHQPSQIAEHARKRGLKPHPPLPVAVLLDVAVTILHRNGRSPRLPKLHPRQLLCRVHLQRSTLHRPACTLGPMDLSHARSYMMNSRSETKPCRLVEGLYFRRRIRLSVFANEAISTCILYPTGYSGNEVKISCLQDLSVPHLSGLNSSIRSAI